VSSLAFLPDVINRLAYEGQIFRESNVTSAVPSVISPAAMTVHQAWIMVMVEEVEEGHHQHYNRLGVMVFCG